MKKILIILLVALAFRCDIAYCENYENNPEACTFVINNINDENEKEVAYFFRGKYYYDNENYSKAIYDLSESIKRAKSEDSIEESYYYRASSYFNSGEYENAIQDYTEAIKRSNNSPDSQAESYTYRARAYAVIQNYQSAIDDATKVIQKGYANKYDWAISAYYTRGASYYFLGQYKNSINDLTNFIQLSKKYGYSFTMEIGDAYLYRGDSRLKAKMLSSHNDVLNIFSDYETAIKVYSKINNPDATTKKGVAANVLKQMKKTYYE